MGSWRFTTPGLYGRWRRVRQDSDDATALAARLKECVKLAESALRETYLVNQVEYERWRKSARLDEEPLPEVEPVYADKQQSRWCVITNPQYKHMRVAQVQAEAAEGAIWAPGTSYYEDKFSRNRGKKEDDGSYDRRTWPSGWNDGDELPRLAKLIEGEKNIGAVVNDLDVVISTLMGQGLEMVDTSINSYSDRWQATLTYGSYTVIIKERKEDD